MKILMKIISLKLFHRFFGQFSKFSKATVAFQLHSKVKSWLYCDSQGFPQPINAQNCHKIIFKSMTFDVTAKDMAATTCVKCHVRM